jgi:hypothetical protein
MYSYINKEIQYIHVYVESKRQEKFVTFDQPPKTTTAIKLKSDSFPIFLHKYAKKVEHFELI